jgi:heme exporter protein A
LVLAVHDLVSARAGRPVHAPVAFELLAGDALLLRGANGSGKSTLLRTLAGFLRPAAGHATWHGLPLADAAWQAAIHWVGHVNAQKGNLTVGENLRLAARLAGAEPDLAAAAESFDLALLLDVAVGRLSQGQRRRAALARLTATPRPVWLLDEPGVGLDAANAARLARLIGEHRARGGIVVVASHGDVTVDAPLVLDL